jgi:hypothetical protein
MWREDSIQADVNVIIMFLDPKFNIDTFKF